jgi:hypothetical protein
VTYRGLIELTLPVGVLMSALGAVDYVRLSVSRMEKPNYYLLGHWIDPFWEVQLPAMVAGIVLILVGKRLSKGSARHGSAGRVQGTAPEHPYRAQRPR